MGALTFQPVSILQETVNENPAPQGAPAAPSTDANLAQSGGAPQDTVILTGKGAETQLSGGGSNGSQPQQTALFFAAQNIFLGQDNAQAAGNPQQVQAPPVPVQTKTPGAPQQPAETSVNISGNSSANSAAKTPQQQLAVLDQTLQELGINPQSISLFNRMSLLLYANDPAALRVLVQTLQGAAQQFRQAGSGSAAASAGQPATAQQPTQPQPEAPPQLGGSTGIESPSGAPAPQSTGGANQFQGLQSGQVTHSIQSDTQGQGVNITI